MTVTSCSLRRALIIRNPLAGGSSKRHGVVREVAARLQSHGVLVDVTDATTPREITEAARVAEFDAIIVAGGDGSVNAAAAGILERRETRPILGVIAAGTANVLAHELRLPRDPADLADLFISCKTRQIHLGASDARPFLLMASAGFDAEIVRSVENGLKKKLGRSAYVYHALRAIFRANPELEVLTEGRVIECKIAIVAKARFYGGKFAINEEGGIFAPGLKLVIVKELSLGHLLALGKMFLIGRLPDCSFVETIPVEEIELRSASPVAVQIDGDFVGFTPVTISEWDGTIEIFCP